MADATRLCQPWISNTSHASCCADRRADGRGGRPWTRHDQPPSRIITLAIRQALTLVLAGMACGLTLAVPMAFAMQATFVAKVTAADPMAFLPTIAVLLAVGILASAVPALRASRVDPIATLRQE